MAVGRVIDLDDKKEEEEDEDEIIIDVDEWEDQVTRLTTSASASDSTMASPPLKALEYGSEPPSPVYESKRSSKYSSGSPFAHRESKRTSLSVESYDSWRRPGFTMEKGNLSDLYRKIRDLGAGSYGTVALYRRKADGETFAIKTVIVDNAKMMEMYDKELKIAYTLNHSNIVTYHGALEDPRGHHLIMDFCRGGDLLSYIDGKGAPRGGEGTKVAASILVQMLSGLAYLNRLDIAHRDLKPENYVVQDRRRDNPDPVIKLIDFGGARTDVGDEDLMHTKVGTFEYAAPEMLMGKPYRKSCDVWSLGCTLFCVCTRSQPTFAQSRDGMFKMILKKQLDITWDEKVWSKHDSRMKTIAQQMLQLDPCARPSAREFLRDQQWLDMESCETFGAPEASTKACCSVQ